MYDIIKESLPNIPDEVISSWLVPIAESGYGWPPAEHDLGRWRYVLAKSLDYWRKTIWSVENIEFDSIVFSPGSKRTIVSLIQTYLQGIQNDFSNIQNGQERFMRLLKYLKAHGKLPVPPVLRKDEGIYEILDGNHRMTALFYLHRLAKDEGQKDMLAKNNFMPLEKTHLIWTFKAPAEGEYEILPLTLEINRMLNSFKGVAN